jgi:glyoxylase-like metal-dependent hydrolase (beta-lactamase superfamily II)
VIFKILEVGPFASNCYVVGSEAGKEGMIIDPGDDARRILQQVKGLGLDIKNIVLTHAHIDHIGGLTETAEATGAQVCAHRGDAMYLEQRPLRGTLTGLPYPDIPAVDRWLNGGDSLDIGDLHFLVLHTPGHSQGCICLLGHGVLFSGDTLFNYGIGRTDLPGGNYSQLMNSIHTKLMVLPDNTVVYPGHGPETTIGAERRSNPFIRG